VFEVEMGHDLPSGIAGIHVDHFVAGIHYPVLAGPTVEVLRRLADQVLGAVAGEDLHDHQWRLGHPVPGRWAGEHHDIRDPHPGTGRGFPADSGDHVQAVGGGVLEQAGEPLADLLM